MSAKLIYNNLTDENKDLQKQIGCMNGLFQLFDRHHFLNGGRRVSRKQLPPVGQSGNDEIETNRASQKAKDKNQKKAAAKEKQRTSSESSRTSFSSSSCSSTFSSLDCNKITQLEPSSLTQTICPETPSQDLPINQSKQLGRRSLDIRDVVKDSINREAHGLSVNTANRETAGHTMKHIDSPRPLQLPFKTPKPRVSNLNESSRALAKLREAPRYSNEPKDCRLLAPKDAPRFSYDGRESRDKSTTKFKELPRLSLDSRVRSMRGPSSENKSNFLMGNQMENAYTRRALNQQEEPGSYKRPSSVVAKLMGLDALPNSTLTNEGDTGLCKPCPDQNLEPISKSSSTANEIYQNRISGSPRNFQQGAISPNMRQADSAMKLSSNSRFPIEPAPWKQSDGSRGSQKPTLKQMESPTKSTNSSPSVYGEIEKRLAELEFKKSGKDLRALKQILEAMHKTKEMLETQQDQSSVSPSLTCNSSPSFRSPDQSSKLADRRYLQSKPPISSTIKQTSSLKTSGSPIVIMKPAKFVRKSSNPAPSTIPIEGLPGLRKLRTGDLADKRENLVDKQTFKDRIPRDNIRGSSNQSHCSIEKNFSPRNLRTPQSSKVSQQMTVESPTSSGRSSGALSPRPQRKQLALEKQPRPATPSTDSSRAVRQVNRHLVESNSRGRKNRTSSPNLQGCDDQLSGISSNAKYLSHQGDTLSQKSENSTSFPSQKDAEVPITGHLEVVITTISQQGGQKHKYPVPRLSEDGSMAELATATPEQPSPVSVLDAMFYRDDLPSPVKKISYAFEDGGTLKSDELIWTSADLSQGSDSTRSNLSFDIDHKKLDNIEQLVQKLRQLNSPHNEISIDCSTPLLENKNEDHHYISEILLASGLLSRDHDSNLMTIQLQPTGHLLTPDMFHFLEQTNARKLSNDDRSKKNSMSIHRERVHRKLVFDVVNEILVCKLVPTGSTEPRFLQNKLAEKIPGGKQLLRELCSEIDQLQAKNSEDILESDDDIFRSILWEDMKQQSPNWTDFGSEVSGLVLDIERLIFKDLVTEVVEGEAAGMRARLGGHCRKLFLK